MVSMPTCKSCCAEALPNTRIVKQHWISGPHCWPLCAGKWVDQPNVAVYASNGDPGPNDDTVMTLTLASNPVYKNSSGTLKPLLLSLDFLDLCCLLPSSPGDLLHTPPVPTLVMAPPMQARSAPPAWDPPLPARPATA